MAPSPDDRCGTRHRRGPGEPDHGPPSAAQEVALSPLGLSLLAALREDDRFRDIIDDPWGPAGRPGADG